ncbi:hypothetical protein [Halioglobus maricola]|uniref:hypothetical protein n=1 Tax=Halioglobus maricola TaxID=2601894 RepID=UPI00197B03C6|nr:hypothetical protein [Halioglobus maricola]
MKIFPLSAIALGMAFAQHANAQSYQFTNCDAEGRLGPGQSDCNTEYAGTTLESTVTVSGGIQAWVVPETGTYLIEADGAAGGTQQYSGEEGSGTPSPGGFGASLQGTFELTAGETLHVLVGQMGGDTQQDVETDDDWENAAPGGGGGTFVYRNSADPLPLLAAGGGGSGSNCEVVDTSLQNASLTTGGNKASGVNGDTVDNGGAGGNGGLGNYPFEGGSSYWAGAGAGWLTDGTGGHNPTDYDYRGDPANEYDTTAVGDGGRSPRNGGEGGLRGYDDNDEGGDGGFGGGGGGGSDNMGGGGGGGFSGGGGADGDDCTNGSIENNPGGGGGSYNGGTDQVNELAGARSHGLVTIRALVIPSAAPQGEATEPTKAVPVMTGWGIGILATLIGLLGMYSRRRK